MARPAMPKNLVGAIIKVLIVCLVVGLALSFFGIDPRNVFASLGETAVAVFDLLMRLGQWAVQYVVIGAMVVVPILLLVFAWRKLTQIRRPRS